jgi:hypothetical protein
MKQALKKIFAKTALPIVLAGSALGAMNCSTMGGSSHYSIGIRSGGCTTVIHNGREHTDCSYSESGSSHYSGPSRYQYQNPRPDFNRAYRYKYRPRVKRLCHSTPGRGWHCH